VSWCPGGFGVGGVGSLVGLVVVLRLLLRLLVVLVGFVRCWWGLVLLLVGFGGVVGGLVGVCVAFVLRLWWLVVVGGGGRVDCSPARTDRRRIRKTLLECFTNWLDFDDLWFRFRPCYYYKYEYANYRH